MQYFHMAKHPNSGFGYHHVYKINGAWGTRWVHNAHCQPGLVSTVTNVKEGQEVAKLGKSGTQYAHVHFAIFKVDPASLRDGIDTIAKTQQELDAWWENPIAFIERYLISGDLQKEVDKLRAERDNNWNLYQQALKEVDVQRQERDKNWNLYQDALKKINEQKGQIKQKLIDFSNNL